ncbi:hypothetical protein MNV_320010 [Candidatus Methanoperedens nitroreducens]|uniref:Uncharacterized protein n=1 Tax=Candidatus Methanoperedens nitratireducens TaxID=1392998 RepID=A0A284VQ48_9EURY|nr:hypothetical protein MNV_320010 [Candidatus Methanoperedens nitroreducens]
MAFNNDTQDGMNEFLEKRRLNYEKG